MADMLERGVELGQKDEGDADAVWIREGRDLERAIRNAACLLYGFATAEGTRHRLPSMSKPHAAD